MNEIKIFDNPEFGKVRTMEINGEPYFVGKDVSEILGYSDTNKAIAMHVDDEDKLNDKTALSLGQRGGWFINESGLYSLVLSSKLPNAKKFKRWITTEVIPSIRKHGAYMTPDPMQRFIADPDFAIGLLTALKDEQAKSRALEAENEKQSQLLADYEPKVQYLETILQSEGTMTTAQIAADYGTDLDENIAEAKRVNPRKTAAGLLTASPKVESEPGKETEDGKEES